MEILHWAVGGLALFFAGSWTLGVAMRPNMRLKSTLVTIALWWALIAGTFAGAINAFHLLWLMPLALVVPSFVMMLGITRGGFPTMLIAALSATVLGGAVFLVVR